MSQEFNSVNVKQLLLFQASNVCLSVYLSVQVSVCPSIYLSISAYLPVCLSGFQYVCVWLVYLSVCICLSVCHFMLVCPCISLYVCPSLSVYQSAYILNMQKSNTVNLVQTLHVVSVLICLNPVLYNSAPFFLIQLHSF